MGICPRRDWNSRRVTRNSQHLDVSNAQVTDPQGQQRHNCDPPTVMYLKLRDSYLCERRTETDPVRPQTVGKRVICERRIRYLGCSEVFTQFEAIPSSGMWVPSTCASHCPRTTQCKRSLFPHCISTSRRGGIPLHRLHMPSHNNTRNPPTPSCSTPYSLFTQSHSSLYYSWPSWPPETYVGLAHCRR